MSSMMPEYGINAYFSLSDALPDFPNLNAYQGLALLKIGSIRTDYARQAIEGTPDAGIVGGAAGKAQAIERLRDVSTRIELWIGILEAKIAALGKIKGETCATLEAPGAGVFTWYLQPGPIVTDPAAPGYTMPGDWQKFGITQEQATTFYTPEYTAADAYAQGYLIDPIQTQEDLDSILDTAIQDGDLNYMCVDLVPPKLATLKTPAARGFPWWIIAAAAGAYAVTRKR